MAEWLGLATRLLERSGPEALRWLGELLASHGFLREFLLDCPLRDVREALLALAAQGLRGLYGLEAAALGRAAEEVTKMAAQMDHGAEDGLIRQDGGRTQVDVWVRSGATDMAAQKEESPQKDCSSKAKAEKAEAGSESHGGVNKGTSESSTLEVVPALPLLALVWATLVELLPVARLLPCHAQPRLQGLLALMELFVALGPAACAWASHPAAQREGRGQAQGQGQGQGWRLRPAQEQLRAMAGGLEELVELAIQEEEAPALARALGRACGHHRCNWLRVALLPPPPSPAPPARQPAEEAFVEVGGFATTVAEALLRRQPPVEQGNGDGGCGGGGGFFGVAGGTACGACGACFARGGSELGGGGGGAAVGQGPGGTCRDEQGCLALLRLPAFASLSFERQLLEEPLLAAFGAQDEAELFDLGPLWATLALLLEGGGLRRLRGYACGSSEALESSLLARVVRLGGASGSSLRAAGRLLRLLCFGDLVRSRSAACRICERVDEADGRALRAALRMGSALIGIGDDLARPRSVFLVSSLLHVARSNRRYQHTVQLVVRYLLRWCRMRPELPQWLQEDDLDGAGAVQYRWLEAWLRDNLGPDVARGSTASSSVSAVFGRWPGGSQRPTGATLRGGSWFAEALSQVAAEGAPASDGELPAEPLPSPEVLGPQAPTGGTGSRTCGRQLPGPPPPLLSKVRAVEVEVQRQAAEAQKRRQRRGAPPTGRAAASQQWPQPRQQRQTAWQGSAQW